MPEETKEKAVETLKEEEAAETSKEDKFVLFEQKVTTLLDVFGTEIGKQRKEREERQEREDLLSNKLVSIEEKLSTKEEQENQFDPYDKEQQKGMISDLVNDVVKPLIEKQADYLTRDSMSEMLQVAASGASLKKDFKLKDKEVEELNAEAQEKGINVEHLAYQKYGDRRFVKNVNAELADEMKKKDTGQPEETALEAEYKKVGIPKDHHEFNKSYLEKGADVTKQALLSADKAAGV